MSAIRRAAEHVGAAAQRLADALASPAGTRALLARLGWSVSVVPEEWLRLATRAEQVVDAVDALSNDPSLEDLALVLEAAEQLRASLEGLSTAPPGVDRDALLADMGERLLQVLLVEQLARGAPRVFAMLRGLGVVRGTVQVAAPGRLSHVRYRVETERLAELARDPRRAAEELYGWGTTSINEHALLAWLLDVTAELGLPARHMPLDDTFPRYADIRVGKSMLDVPIFDVAVGALPVRLALEIAVALPDEDELPGLVIAPSIPGLTGGALRLGRNIGLRVRSSTGAPLDLAVIVRPDDVDVRYPGDSSDRLPAGGLVVECEVDLPGARIGSRGGSRVELDGVTATFSIADSGGLDVGLRLRPNGARIVLAPGEQDGVLRRLLGDRELTLPVVLELGWSSKTGVTIAAGTQIALPMSVAVGPLIIQRGVLSIDATEGRLASTVTAGAMLRLGPVSLEIDRIGGHVTVDSGLEGSLGIGALDVGPVWPRAAGLQLDAGPVRGGGLLSRDPTSGQYAGVVALELSGIHMFGAALVATRTPEGANRFSLAAIASARFPGIPIGLGFNLHGIGGLVALHRRVDDDRVRRGLASGQVQSLLQPEDAADGLQPLLARMQEFFPISPGRHVVGPTVQIGWGSPRIFSMDLAILAELPSPVRIVVLGAAELGLPTLAKRVVDIRLDLIGVVDLARQTLALDASLHDSSIAGYELTGDMALRLGWGDQPHFLLAIGGFHPRFRPPPSFPALRRVALTIGDNPRLRLEAYFALTSNTVQFGAHVDLDYKVSGLKIAGHLHFDALLELRPLYLEAEIKAGVAISYRGHNLASARLSFLLTGPRPWRAKGSATIGILWWDVSVGFDATWGDRRQPELPPPPDVSLILRTALVARAAWAGELPPGERTWLVLRDRIPRNEICVHPLSTLVVRQRAVPLDHAISQFGSTPLAGTLRFKLVGIRIGTATFNDPPPVYDYFAPAQFTRLRSDELLAAPSFESMRSGIRFAADAVALGETARASMEHTTVVHDPLAPPEPPRKSAVTTSLLETVVAQRAATPRPTRGQVRIRSLTYVLASTRDLSITAEGAAIAAGRTTYAGLREALREARRASRRPVLQIVPRVETTNRGGRVVVVHEDDNLRNVDFVDTVTGRQMTREEFVVAIEGGEYPDYHVRMMHGLPTPVSRPNASVDDNLG